MSISRRKPRKERLPNIVFRNWQQDMGDYISVFDRLMHLKPATYVNPAHNYHVPKNEAKHAA